MHASLLSLTSCSHAEVFFMCVSNIEMFLLHPVPCAVPNLSNGKTWKRKLAIAIRGEEAALVQASTPVSFLSWLQSGVSYHIPHATPRKIFFFKIIHENRNVLALYIHPKSNIMEETHLNLSIPRPSSTSLADVCAGTVRWHVRNGWIRLNKISLIRSGHYLGQVF